MREDIDKYEIPAELKKNPKNYNLLPPKIQILPDIKGNSKTAAEDDTMRTRTERNDINLDDSDLNPETTSIQLNENDNGQNSSALIDRKDSFQDQKERFQTKQKELNEQSAKLKQEHAKNIEEQENLLQQKLTENDNDPVFLLKRYFDNK